MGGADDPGYDRVTDRTRAFEREDAQSSAARRGPTSGEVAAAERAAPLSVRTREAYRSYVFRPAHAPGEGRI